MDDRITELRRYLDGEAADTPAAEDLRALISAYPYFAAPVAAMLRIYGDSLEEGELAELRSRLAILLGGTDEAVRAAAGVDDSGFYPPQGRKRPDTNDALDTFFATYGKTTPEEEALLERLIFNPVPDYSELLAHEEGREPAPEPGDGLPDMSGFAAALSESRKSRPETEENSVAAVSDKPETEKRTPESKASAPASDDSLLSESLAKIFIKQGRYERAYEIISNLNLNYPEKSVYFADQLRFLRKLILIQKKNNQK